MIGTVTAIVVVVVIERKATRLNDRGWVVRMTGLNEALIILNIVALVKDTGPKNLAVRHTHTQKCVAKSVIIQQSVAPVEDDSPTKLRATVNFLLFCKVHLYL